MKKQNILFILFAFFSLVFMSNCTNNKDVTKEFFEKYEGEDGFIIVNLPPGIARILIDENEKEFREVLKEVDKVKILIFNNNDEGLYKGKKNEILDDLFTKLNNNGFEDLIVFKEETREAKVVIKENNEIVKELLIVFCEDETFISVNLVGNIKMGSVLELSKKMDINEIKRFIEMGR